MTGGFNIGTECFALLTTSHDPEFLLPVKIIILEKYTLNNRKTYKVKIRDIFESDFNYLKENFSLLRLSTTLKSETSQYTTNKPTFVKKSVMDTFNNKTEFLTYLNDKPFFLEENYITYNKEGLRELYDKFVKYLINFHFGRLYKLMSRSFLANTPIFENQKDMFLKRVNKIGFEDIFKRYDLDIEI